jgi:hypothetical protein
MKRYFFLEESLDDLELIERKLLARGMARPQIHVLSHDDAGVSGHRINEVHSLLRQDTIHASEIGALIGFAIAVVSVAIAYVSGLPETIGWAPFVMLSLILLGFFTWEGGFFGFQMPNSRYRRFDDALRQGRHLLIVDVDHGQDYMLQQVLDAHPHVKPAGSGVAAPRWLLRWRQHWDQFVQWAP